MKSISLNIKKYYNGKANVLAYDFEKKVFYILLISFGVLCICYLYVVGSMISNILERKSLETHARNVSNELSELEIKYFTMSKDINLSLSSMMGFKEVKADFATRKTLGFATEHSSKVKLANNEI